MGAVYEARNHLLGKRSAIKVVLPDRASNKAAVERLLVEARAAAAVEHPNIVPIIDCGLTDSGEPFVQMPLLEGVNLDEYCDEIGAKEGHRNRLEVATAAPIFFQVLSALAAVHDRRIVHRDLKGGNIMVLPDGSIRIVDFGIAKLFDPALSGVHTQTSQVLGSPGYMAPEQARSGPIDARADLWSAGAVFFRVLTGRRPFEGQTFIEMAAQAMVAPRPHASTLVPSIPESVSKILSACLAADPGARPQSARELAFQLMDAIPGGLEIAERVAPDLLLRGGPRDPTLQTGLKPSAVPVEQRGLEPSKTPADDPRPSIAAGPARETARARSTLQLPRSWPRSRRVVLLTVPVVIGLGVAAVVVFNRHDRAAPGSSAEPANRSPQRPATPSASTQTSSAAAEHPSSSHEAGTISGPEGPGENRGVPAAPPPAATPAIDSVSARTEESAADRAGRDKSKNGILLIKVHPFADVWIDGKPVGSTPVRIELAVGRHRVELRGPMDQNESLRVSVRAGRTTRITRTWRTR